MPRRRAISHPFGQNTPKTSAPHGYVSRAQIAHQTNVPDFATAYYLLEGLNEIGIDYLFCNFGTDHAPIIEEMAHRREARRGMPSVVRCPHENTAAHMAAGYALVTGRGQGVLVHVDVGTANAANGMHNLFRSRLPVLLMAGKAPFTANASWSARATTMCISCRSRSTRRAWCGPM